MQRVLYVRTLRAATPIHAMYHITGHTVNISDIKMFIYLILYQHSRGGQMLQNISFLCFLVFIPHGVPQGRCCVHVLTKIAEGYKGTTSLQGPISITMFSWQF